LENEFDPDSRNNNEFAEKQTVVSNPFSEDKNSFVVSHALVSEREDVSLMRLVELNIPVSENVSDGLRVSDSDKSSLIDGERLDLKGKDFVNESEATKFAPLLLKEIEHVNFTVSLKELECERPKVVP
jgi:hypothetical protein